MPSLTHKSVLSEEAIAGLAPRSGGLYADGTLGGGGHAVEILKASRPLGRLVGCDRDRQAIEAVRRVLSEFEGRFDIRQGNYADLPKWVEAGSCDGVLLDLGISSIQLDSGERGFSFMEDGPLDMRMDPESGRTAADIVNGADVEELARIFWEYGGETESRRFARAIDRDRRIRVFERTRQLAELIEKISPRGGRRAHPATKLFQALRIAVNDEFGSLRRGLAGALEILKPGGRLAVITFHSSEDRIVKEFGHRMERDYEPVGPVDIPELRKARPPLLRWIGRKAVKPGARELAENPRSRSAQLRIFEKLG